MPLPLVYCYLVRDAQIQASEDGTGRAFAVYGEVTFCARNLVAFLHAAQDGFEYSFTCD